MTDVRFQCGIQYVKEQNLPISKESISKFVMWIVEDVQKEIFKEDEDNDNVSLNTQFEKCLIKK